MPHPWIQGQAGCGSGQPGLVVGNPAHSRGLKLDDHCGPFQPKPFYDSMILCFYDYMKKDSICPFPSDVAYAQCRMQK